MTSYYRMPPSFRQKYDSEFAMWDEANVDVVIQDPNRIVALLSQDYLDSRGFEQVATLPGENGDVVIYQRKE